MTGARIHVAHLSSAAALSAAQWARAAGARLSTEACLPHLFLTRNLPLGSLGKVAPPLRSHDDLTALREGVHEAAVDVVASDHCGYHETRKSAADFPGSGNGLPGLELLLPLLVDAAIEQGWLTEEELVRVLCSGPARVFGIEGKGRLSPGSDADIVLIDPTSSSVVQHARLHDRAFYTPYEGRRLRGAIKRVIRRGATVVLDGAATEGLPGRSVRIGHSLPAG
jgi:dihydropyrimidinase